MIFIHKEKGKAICREVDRTGGLYVKWKGTDAER